jgi:hypothetical protein
VFKLAVLLIPTVWEDAPDWDVVVRLLNVGVTEKERIRQEELHKDNMKFLKERQEYIKNKMLTDPRMYVKKEVTVKCMDKILTDKTDSLFSPATILQNDKVLSSKHERGLKAAGIKIKYEKLIPKIKRIKEIKRMGKTTFISVFVSPGNKNNMI